MKTTYRIFEENGYYQIERRLPNGFSYPLDEVFGSYQDARNFLTNIIEEELSENERVVE